LAITTRRRRGKLQTNPLQGSLLAFLNDTDPEVQAQGPQIPAFQVPILKPATPPPLPPPPAPRPAGPSFRPDGQGDLAPTGSVARAGANLAALVTLREIQDENRAATAAEQAILARWSGWGAIPEVWDTRNQPAWAQKVAAELLDLTSEEERRAAARSTLNAHYTDAAFVQQIWQAAALLGFTSGKVIEPGCGSGNFIGLAPPGARMTGVELDPLTAQIAQALYPQADIRRESFADSKFAEESFDLAVANVPFGDLQLPDARYNPDRRHSIHNHFILKAMHLLRPGGIGLFLTSRYTMDGANPESRRAISKVADVLGAVRLPSGAHQAAAGTSVVTDLVVLRRRDRGAEPAGEDWERARAIEVDDQELIVSDWFTRHRAQVLGKFRCHGMWRADDLTVEFKDTRAALNEALAEALENIVAEARMEGLTWARAREALPEPDESLETGHPDGFIQGTPGTGFTIIDYGQPVRYEVPAEQAGELAALLRLRDAARDLLAAEAADAEDTPEILAQMGMLGEAYTTYVASYGPINRFSYRRTGRYGGTCEPCGEYVKATTHGKPNRDGSPGNPVWQQAGVLLAQCHSCHLPVRMEDRLAQIRPPQGGFRKDPYYPLVLGLETFSPETQTATRAPIFTTRVTAPRTPRLGADTPDDALTICLDTHGQVDLEEIARLLGTTPEDARDRLASLVYEVPPDPEGDQEALLAHAAADISALSGLDVNLSDITGKPAKPGPDEVPTGSLVPAAQYLSGKVRRKLQVAEAAARTDPAFEVNVRALREVVPRDKTPGEIDARMGASWIGVSFIQAFLRELLDDEHLKVEHPGGQIWAVKGDHRSVLATSTYGTGRRNAVDLAAAILQQHPIQVRDTIMVDGSERQVLNLDETVAANAKADLIKARFADWAWGDPARSARLARTYNDMFNGLVVRSYDDYDAARMSLPGMNVDWKAKVHTHQYPAIARMVHEPTALLAHEVGAGKTLEMVAGVMEMRRLGLISKACVVVPNHMLEQFSREWMALYPQARVLLGQREDLDSSIKRRRFIARCATGDWDAVVISMSAFERIGMTREAQEDYLNREIALLEEWIDNAQDAEGLTLKRLERTKWNAENRLIEKVKRLPRDKGICFEGMGCDYLVVDEAHLFKNLRTPSAIPDAAIDGSQRASDLDMKLHWLRRRQGRRIATFATATPIANSITEAHVMCRYLRPDVLEDAAVLIFDSWAATFGEVVTKVELAPEGGTAFRLKARFAEFTGISELMQMWFIFADVKLAEDLDLKLPLIACRPEDGKRDSEIVSVDPSPELVDFVLELGQRAEKIRSRAVKPDEDNMLNVCLDGRKAAISMELVGQPQTTPSKIEAAAGKIYEIWQANRDHVYPDSLVPGSLQLVFCDLGTPSEKWNVYDTLRTELVFRGMPANRVRFVHEATNDRAKAQLFAACRAGAVAVLVGSTEKMGVGVNVQDRLVALHELDAPWRPADVAQRIGRAIRQGNLNAEVRLLRYITSRSFDAYMWQALARKATFIGQLIRGRFDTRSVKDIGDVALSFSEIQALATDNPLLLEKAVADSEFVRLDRAERAWERTLESFRYAVTANQDEITWQESVIARVQEAMGRREPVAGEDFRIIIGAQEFTDRAEAHEAFRQVLHQEYSDAKPGVRAGQSHGFVPLGWLGGFQVKAHFWVAQQGSVLADLVLDEMPFGELRGLNLTEIWTGKLITRLENRLTGMEGHVTEARHVIERASREIEHASKGLAESGEFAQAAELAAARQLVEEINAELARLANERAQPHDEPAAQAA
jgi:N12 class adenine-specific DNA methylase